MHNHVRICMCVRVCMCVCLYEYMYVYNCNGPRFTSLVAMLGIQSYDTKIPKNWIPVPIPYIPYILSLIQKDTGTTPMLIEGLACDLVINILSLVTYGPFTPFPQKPVLNPAPRMLVKKLIG